MSTRDEICRLVFEEGLSKAEAARRTGVSRQYVGQLTADRPGHTLAGRAAAAAAASAAVAQKHAEARPGLIAYAAHYVELHREGLSFQEIADLRGVTRNIVAGEIYRYRKWTREDTNAA
jgi:hypothetical protein